MKRLSVPVIVGARHVRVTAAHLEVLFGAPSLTELLPLPLTEWFAAAEVVRVQGPQGTLANVRVLGPLHARTEVHITLRDLATLGFSPDAATRDHATSPGCTLFGPRGSVFLSQGVLTGLRALALSSEVAHALHLEPGATTNVLVQGERARELRDVPVHIATTPSLTIDIDDANAIEADALTSATVGP